ncbi:hypothetical protein BO221_27795 [Archangium sp. Cb G35]|uniref:hypothetical protein n=1 Tax=Archangium sp. Cb G35 TaxID=1920190 RepID=UPI0009357032|nr:hypothetical protein [Archangium sp. Cb G35]OJT21609.1 hypothetical protein BO221_27795 [Archangium sp. Cb G35]
MPRRREDRELQSLACLSPAISRTKIAYRRWDAKGRRKHPDSVTIRDCDSNTNGSISIKVPTTWLDQGVGFKMNRDSRSERWEILVDKDEVPFPALKEALEHFRHVGVEASRYQQAGDGGDT